MNNSLVYITTFFESKNEERKKEILTCISQNIESGFFKRCIILTEEKTVTYFNKYSRELVELVNLPMRPSYQDAFNYRSEDTINVIANSDILFNRSIQRIKSIGNKDFFALSRYENINGTLKVLYPFRGWTQDVWVVMGKREMRWEDEKFYFGQPGCDHLMAYIAKASGYKVTNPSFSICTIHQHRSLSRTAPGTMEAIKSVNQYFPKPSFLAFGQTGTSDYLYWANILLRKLFMPIVSLKVPGFAHVKYKFFDRMF